MKDIITLCVGFVVMLIVIVIVSSVKCEIDYVYTHTDDSHDWDQSSYETYMKIWSTFGNPIYYDNRAGGQATWIGDQLSDTYWTQITVYENGYISTTVKFDIPQTKVNEVLDIDGSISYNKMQAELTVMCDNIPCIIATTYAVVQFVSDMINASDAKEIIKKYGINSISQIEYDTLSYNLSTLLDTA